MYVNMPSQDEGGQTVSQKGQGCYSTTRTSTKTIGLDEHMVSDDLMVNTLTEEVLFVLNVHFVL
jgi:hypothetical protein